jgi:hypothetical protein
LFLWPSRKEIKSMNRGRIPLLKASTSRGAKKEVRAVAISESCPN